MIGGAAQSVWARLQPPGWPNNRPAADLAHGVQADHGLPALWLTGGATGPEAAGRWTAAGAGAAFDWRFPERLDPACREARSLFRGRHLGLPQQGGLTVRLHPDLATRPAAGLAGWLDDPWLNRLPALLWIFGPATDHRLRHSRVDGGETLLLLLRHARSGCQSWLRLIMAPGVRRGGQPHGEDVLELSGSDGFLTVRGILGHREGAPRLQMHRGPAVHARRDLPEQHTAPPRISPRRLRAATADYLRLCAALRAAG